ncbi:MAG: hypothetical protein ACD_62C00294G0009 [uncultured bacterium]|nr:MAG: hypothetical protein ACD_62C00294G0009 [uncultured bacterium]HLD45323.1 hypothetical protein [bacterium]
MGRIDETNLSPHEPVFFFDDEGTAFLFEGNSVPEQHWEPCDAFDDQVISIEFERLTKKEEFPKYSWGDCEKSTIINAQTLHPLLADYHPTYTYVWGDRFGTGHAWLETQVCGASYLTDLVGGSEAGGLFGYGLNYFTPINNMQTSQDIPGYFMVEHQHELSTNNPLNLDSSAYAKKQAEARDTLPRSVLENLVRSGARFLERVFKRNKPT